MTEGAVGAVKIITTNNVIVTAIRTNRHGGMYRVVKGVDMARLMVETVIELILDQIPTSLLFIKRGLLTERDRHFKAERERKLE